ncbi:hypothetical protein TPR58_19585 [Sphingomonas sp. HF-S3]|jgi:hypothetical protein|uniref:DUF2147 domain-containing protein n=1 Tax=Sphingomonas rustica TaxID=3103142 RepID=A0ABV0BEX3_9SPHN
MLLTSLALLLTAQAAPTANWVVLEQSAEGTVSVDKASIRPEGAGRFFTMRVAMEGKGEAMLDMVLDCKANTVVPRAARVVKDGAVQNIPIPDSEAKVEKVDPKLENDAKLIALVCK